MQERQDQQIEMKAKALGFAKRDDAFSVQIMHSDFPRFFIRIERAAGDRIILSDLFLDGPDLASAVVALDFEVRAVSASESLGIRIRDIAPMGQSARNGAGVEDTFRLVLTGLAKTRGRFLANWAVHEIDGKTDIFVDLEA